MEAKELIEWIGNAEKQTPVKVYIKVSEELNFVDCQVFGCKKSPILIGDYAKIEPQLKQYKDYIIDCYIENNMRNSAISLLDLKQINARIEPGAIIRDGVTIKDHAVIMMGAIINVGAIIGERTMIDMGCVLGGRAIVGDDCHIGAGTVLAGVIEPANANPVIIEDHVVIGANAVVIEGVRVGNGSVVAAGSVVISDVESGVMVAGSPAKVMKRVDGKTSGKTALEETLRNL